jgi:hypothetical protein
MCSPGTRHDGRRSRAALSRTLRSPIPRLPNPDRRSLEGQGSTRLR